MRIYGELYTENYLIFCVFVFLVIIFFFSISITDVDDDGACCAFVDGCLMLFTAFELSSLVVRWSNVIFELVVSGSRHRRRCRKFIVTRVNELGVEQFERDYMKHSFDTLVHTALFFVFIH